MSITAADAARSTETPLERADGWGQHLAEHLDRATLWVWGDRAHRDDAHDLVDGLIERGAIGSVRHLRLDAPLSASRTAPVRPSDVVLLYLGASTPRSALLALRRTRATIWAVASTDAASTDLADEVLIAEPDELRRLTARVVLAYARTTRRRHPDAPPPLPFAAAYPRQVLS